MQQNNNSLSIDQKFDLLLKRIDDLGYEMRDEINVFRNEINTRMDQVLSENRARHYDMQNISLANNGLSLSGLVSSSQAAGRSPRVTLNSFDTFH